MARAIGVEHRLPLGGVHWTGHQRMFWSHGHVDHDWTGSRNNVYLGQNSSNCILTIGVFMVCKFALIFKSLQNTYFLFLVHWQGKEETQEMYTVEGLWKSSPHVITSFHRFLEVLRGSWVDRHSSLSLLLVRFLVWLHPDPEVMTCFSGLVHR